MNNVLTFWHVPCPEPVAWSWQRPAVSWVQRRTLLQPSWITSAQPGWCVRWQRSSCYLCCYQTWWISLYVGFLIGTKTVKTKITSKVVRIGRRFLWPLRFASSWDFSRFPAVPATCAGWQLFSSLAAPSHARFPEKSNQLRFFEVGGL